MSEQHGNTDSSPKSPDRTKFHNLAEIRKPKVEPELEQHEAGGDTKLPETVGVLAETALTGGFMWESAPAPPAFLPMVNPVSRQEREGRELGILTFRDSESGFELTMTDDFYGFIKQKYGGANSMRQIFMDLRAQVLGDPFGERNIDAFIDTDAGQWARVVQKLPEDGPLADLVPGKKLAVKTTGMDMEATRKYLERGSASRSKLTDQFRATRELIEVQKKVAPQGFADGLITVADVYAVLREPRQDGDYEQREWMLMEYIAAAHHVKEKRIALMGGGVSPGFSPVDYPELAAVVMRHQPWSRPSSVYEFSDLGEALADKQYGSPNNGVEKYLSDLRGQNMLETINAEGNKHYTIIDVQRSSGRR